MSTENEIENLDTTTEVSESHSEPVFEKASPKVEPRFNREEKSDKSIRTLLKTNIDKIKEEDETLPLTTKEKRAVKAKVEPTEKVPDTAKESPTTPPKKEVVEDKNPKESKSEESVPPTTPQASGIPAPAALTKEEKELWGSLPEAMQHAFLRREADTQKGIDKLKAQYKPIEDALAPIRPMLAQRGMTEGHAVKQLFDWHAALASPHKASQVAAFKALAQSHGVDLNLLAPQQPQPTQQSENTQDPFAQIQPYLEQTIQPIRQQLSVYEAQLQNQKMETANKELEAFSADKPHFEKVRSRMAEILQIASSFGRAVTLQQAYDEAVWGDPEIRSEIMQAEESKRQAEFRSAQENLQKKLQDEFLAKQKKEEDELAKKRELEVLEKARRANVSPRSTTPVGTISPKQPKGHQSVADTLRATINSLSSTI